MIDRQGRAEKPQMRSSRIALAAALLWVFAVFGSYIALILQQIWFKLTTLVGG